MVRTVDASHGPARGSGMVLAVVSALSFGSSGPMGKALLEAGWTPGAAVLVRLGGAAVLLTVAALVVRRGRWRLSTEAVRQLLVYGLVAMAGTQLAYFNAVRTLDVGVALLLEYLAPVLLLAWTTARTRIRPAGATLAGAAATLVGLVLVLDLTGAAQVDPVGVAWGLVAATCLAGYFAMSSRTSAELSPLDLAAGGTAVGAVVIAAAGLTGIVPLGFASAQTVVADLAVPWLVPAAWLVVVSTVAAYLTGIEAMVRLGARLGSFVGLTEVLFAVLIAWAVLGELPRPMQLVGGVAIVAGIVVIQRTERTGGPPRPVGERRPTARRRRRTGRARPVTAGAAGGR